MNNEGCNIFTLHISLLKFQLRFQFMRCPAIPPSQGRFSRGTTLNSSFHLFYVTVARQRITGGSHLKHSRNEKRREDGIHWRTRLIDRLASAIPDFNLGEGVTL